MKCLSYRLCYIYSLVKLVKFLSLLLPDVVFLQGIKITIREKNASTAMSHKMPETRIFRLHFCRRHCVLSLASVSLT